FVDVNLTLINWAPFTVWQAQRWNELLSPVALAQQYSGVVFVWWAAFIAVLLWLRAGYTLGKQKVVWCLLALTIGGLLVGHNAQSRDIYNYLFNAKMVMEYGADPHIKT